MSSCHFNLRRVLCEVPPVAGTRNSKEWLMNKLILATLLAVAVTAAHAQDAPVPPKMHEGYVCTVFLRDIGMPEKALVFAVTRSPDCHGEWEWDHNYVCPQSDGNSTNPYACGKTEYSAAERQIIHDQLMAASERRLRVFAVRGACQAADATWDCFAELGYMNMPAPPAAATQNAQRTHMRRASNGRVPAAPGKEP